MVNQIAELQKKICNLERDIEVILLHSINRDAVTLTSENQNVKLAIGSIYELHNKSRSEGFDDRFEEATSLLPTFVDKDLLKAYIYDGVGRIEFITDKYPNE